MSVTTEQDLPPECLDDDPPQHCYEEQPDGEASSITHLPETGFDVVLVLLIAAVLVGVGEWMRRRSEVVSWMEN